MSTVIKVQNLHKTYSGSKAEILKGIDLTVREGEFIAIMGRSGCGKTTFLKTLGLIETASSGEILYGNQNVGRLWSSEVADLRRRRIGYVFQNYNLMNSLTARENILLPAILDKTEASVRNTRADQLIERFGIGELGDKYPHQMSGGEQQRVALCRALMNDPAIILADEPTGNLDSRMGKIVIETLVAFNEEFGKTVILVTHDPKIARYCKSVIFMKDGVFFDRLDRKNARPEDPDGNQDGQAGNAVAGEAAFYREILAHVEEL